MMLRMSQLHQQQQYPVPDGKTMLQLSDCRDHKQATHKVVLHLEYVMAAELFMHHFWAGAHINSM